MHVSEERTSTFLGVLINISNDTYDTDDIMPQGFLYWTFSEKKVMNLFFYCYVCVLFVNKFR